MQLRHVVEVVNLSVFIVSIMTKLTETWERVTPAILNSMNPQVVYPDQSTLKADVASLL